MSSSGESKNVSIGDLVSSARSFDEGNAVSGTVQITGTLRRSSDRDSLVLILSDGSQRIAKLKMADVVAHEVIQELTEGDKLIKIYVRPDAEVNISEKVFAATIAGSTISRAVNFGQAILDPRAVLRDAQVPFAIDIPHMAPEWRVIEQLASGLTGNTSTMARTDTSIMTSLNMDTSPGTETLRSMDW